MPWISGKQFNQKYNHEMCIFETDKNVFKTLNTLIELYFDKENINDGLEFFIINELPLLWDKSVEYCYKVVIPDSADIYVGKNKFISNKFILKERVKVKNLDLWNDEVYRTEAIEINPDLEDLLSDKDWSFGNLTLFITVVVPFLIPSLIY